MDPVYNCTGFPLVVSSKQNLVYNITVVGETSLYLHPNPGRNTAKREAQGNLWTEGENDVPMEVHSQ